MNTFDFDAPLPNDAAARIGRITAEALDALEAEGLRLTDAILVLEVRMPDGGSAIRTMGTNGRYTVASGMIRGAQLSLDASLES